MITRVCTETNANKTTSVHITPVSEFQLSLAAIREQAASLEHECWRFHLLLTSIFVHGLSLSMNKHNSFHHFFTRVPVRLQLFLFCHLNFSGEGGVVTLYSGGSRFLHDICMCWHGIGFPMLKLKNTCSSTPNILLSILINNLHRLLHA